IDHALRRLGREHFRHRRLARDARGALVLGPGRAIDEERRCVDLARALRDRALRELQLGERRAEELAARRALHGLMHSEPSAAAPTVERNTSSVAIATLKPSPAAPRRLASGTRTPSNRSVASGCGAMTSMRSLTLSPGVAASTTNAESPLAPAASPVRTK